MLDKKSIFNNAKTVAIYGTGPYVENIYNFMKDVNKNILYFIDNSDNRNFCGIDVVNIDFIGQFQQPDIFIIGSGKSDLIVKEKFKQDLIRRGIDERKIFISYNMWKYGIYEKSDICNAKCPYCAVNSSHNINIDNRKFIKPDNFEDALDKLLEDNIIDKTSIIHLYNWGEPFMHPHINEILHILYKKGILYALSTNASIIPNIKKEYLYNLDKIKISMPGFTQKSYDRIHRFEFKKILNNIDKLFDIVGDKNKIEIFFYVYQFNLKEMEPAKEYFHDKGVQITHRIASFNDYNKFLSYANRTMNINELIKVSKELLLYYVDDFISLNQNYKCFYMKNTIVIDENLDYATCCILPRNHRNYNIGNLKLLSKEELIRRKESQPICRECFETGITYWMNNVLEYNDFIVNGILIR